MELEEIIDGCFENNRRHQEALYKLLAAKMYTVCLTYTKDRDTAQDILHDAFFKVFKKFYQYDRAHHIEAWVRSIMVNTAIDHVRRITKFRNIELEERHDHLNSVDTIREHQQTGDLTQIINMLPLGARTVFNLYTLEGYKHHEIAAKLGISEGTSKSQFSRAKSLLQKLVNQYYLG